MAAILLYFSELIDLLKFDLFKGLTLLLIVLFFDFYLERDSKYQITYIQSFWILHWLDFSIFLQPFQNTFLSNLLMP